MKPEGKEYEKEVIAPKVWEEINGEHHLVTKEVSDYIRSLEEEIANLNRLLTQEIAAKRELKKQIK